MLRLGKMNEIGNEIVKFKLDIVAMQEIRWQRQGRIHKQEYLLMYSGPKRRTGLYGTGFISKRVKNCVLEFEAINERFCKLRLKGRFRNITIISAHALTEDSEEEEEKEELCWDSLRSETTWLLKVPASHISEFIWVPGNHWILGP
jgi:exonuclease III